MRRNDCNVYLMRKVIDVDDPLYSGIEFVN